MNPAVDAPDHMPLIPNRISMSKVPQIRKSMNKENFGMAVICSLRILRINRM
jgi:hypothetical protein